MLGNETPLHKLCAHILRTSCIIGEPEVTFRMSAD